MTTRRIFMTGTAALAAMGLPVAAKAQDKGSIRLAVVTEWFALDPHFHTFPANLSMAHC